MSEPQAPTSPTPQAANAAPILSPEATPAPVAAPATAADPLLSGAAAAVAQPIADDDWKAPLPQDLRNDPSVINHGSMESAIKSLVHAQRTIGKKRIASPEDSWGESEYSEYYNALGRPEEPTGYADPAAPEGLPEGAGIPAERLTAVKEAFHKAGLSSKQASEVLDFYYGTIGADLQQMQDTRDGDALKSQEALRAEWGSKYDIHVAQANGVLRQFGTPELATALNESGFGNNPELIRMLTSMASAMGEDDTGDGLGLNANSLPMGSAVRAKAEIEELKSDGLFMQRLTQKSDPGHNDAVARWTKLHGQVAS